jgi:pimeloyl-ACP methyl ester carboxylesterase
MTPVRHSQYLAEQIRGSELVLVPQAGHMVQLEQPQRVLEAIRDFLGGIQYP